MFQENSIKTCILSRVEQITSPGWMHETSARTQCTGKSQRDWVDREMGGWIGMGNTCISMADSCQRMTKPLQYCKIIILQLKTKKESAYQCRGHRCDPCSGTTGQLSPCTTSPEAHMLQSLGSTTADAPAMRSPLTATRESPGAATRMQSSQKQMNK